MAGSETGVPTGGQVSHSYVVETLVSIVILTHRIGRAVVIVSSGYGG